MEFVIFNKLDSKELITDSSNVAKFRSWLEDNLNYTRSYYKRTEHHFTNDFMLCRLIDSLGSYKGRTPSDTHTNVRDNLRYICNLFGIAYMGVEQKEQNILLGKDLLVSVESKVDFTIEGFLPKALPIFNLYHHDSKALSFQDFVYTPVELNSIISIDLPLLAATWHQEELLAIKEETFLTTNMFLTKHFFSRNMIRRCINYSIMNRLETRALDIPETYSPNYPSLPYMHRNVDELYYKVEGELVERLAKTEGKPLETVLDNLSFMVSKDKLTLNLDDYYSSDLMFYNAAVEVALINKIKSCSLGFNLDTNTRSVDNRLKLLLGRNKFTSYTRHLDKELVEYYNELLEQ